MSTRKLSGRLNTNSPTSTISSTDSNNTTTALLTVPQSPTKLSPLSISPTSLSLKCTTDNSINSSQITTDTKKRRRRTSVLASPSLLSSSSSSTSSKKIDENDETLSSVSDAIPDDDKSLKVVNDEEIKDDKDDKEKETSLESPARSRRRKLYENKTVTSPMVTRKTTMDSVRNTRSLRCIRRDSQGKLEGFFEICPPKRPYRRKTNSTPELSTPTKRKKDEISGRDDDDESALMQKKIKIEKVFPEDDIEKIEDEEYMKDEDDMEKSYLDETVKTEAVDSTIGGETDRSDIATSLQDSILHEDATEVVIEEQQEEKMSQESEPSTEIAPEEDIVPPVVPVKVGSNRGRPPRNKQKVIEVKPKPVKKGRKPKAPVIRKIQPTRSVTKKAKESIRSTVNSVKEDIKAGKQQEIKEGEVSGVEEPLSVDTNVAITTAEKESSLSASCSGGETSEKAASLSPDLVSEGVHVQIIKDFYKKPEFLENNRGIEKDPKLGEIVQKVEQINDDGSEETEKSSLVIEEENKAMTADEDDDSVIKESKDNEEQEKNVECETDENSEKTKMISEDDEEKTKILDDNSQQSVDLDLFSLKTLNETDGNDTYNVDRDEDETCGSGDDSLKENEILLVLEDSNDEEGSSGNINEKVAMQATGNDVEREKEEIKSQDLNESNVLSENNGDSLIRIEEVKTISTSLATEEDEGPEVDLRPICDKINSNNNGTSNSNCSNINSDNNDKAVDENEKDEEEDVAVDDDMAIKDNKVDDDDDDHDSTDDKKMMEIGNDNSQMKAIQKQETEEKDDDEEEGGTELLKEEEKIETKDQLNLQMEVDSGISDAVTDTNEDVSMHEISHEVKMECLKTIDDDKCDELTAAATAKIVGEPSTSSGGLGVSKKPSKKLKEERDLKKVEKVGSAEPPLLQSKLQETPETLRQKENHLKSLGLLTHKAAVEAKIEKQRRRKQLQSNLISSLASKKNGNSSSSSSSSSNGSTSSIASNGSNGGAPSINSGGSICNKNTSEEYTGTLKTVIKLNRQGNTVNTVNETKRKSIGNGSNGGGNGNGNGHGSNGNGNGNNGGASSSSSTEGRQSLKMTFQKGRGRPPNSLKDAKDFTHSGEETTYYTIQNENEGSQQHNSVSHGRKSYNRSHTTVDMNHHTSTTTTTTTTAAATTTITTATTTTVTATSSTAVATTSSSSETQEPQPEKVEENKLILIPEKASSFGIHPGRLCQDQCFYCGGRFGLYDTPCHVAQLKSEERKQKILANEEKLTIDNCLCDACFRHVVRRAKDSASSSNYKPRISAPAALETSATATSNSAAPSTDDEVIVQDEVTIVDDAQPTTSWAATTATTNKPNCFVPDCKNQSSHSLRRKCIRKTIKKLVPNFDLSKIGATAPICEKHYNTVIQFLGCALCKRRLGKNHMQYINQDSEKLGKLLGQQGIPVKLASNSAVCKLCRYFVNLILKPPDHGKLQKEQFVKNYRRRLLHFHNIQSGETSDIEDQSSPPENKTESENSKKKPVVVEKQVIITKSKRGRKPKNQAVAAAVAAAIAKASAAVATATVTTAAAVAATVTITTTATATASTSSSTSIHHHNQSSESEKSCSNIGTGSNTPQSSDDGNEKLVQSVTAVNSNPVSGQIILDNDVMVDYDMPVPLDTPSPPPMDPPPPPPPPPPSTLLSQQQSSITSKLQSILQSSSGGGGGGGSTSTSSSSSSTPKEDISIVLRSNPNISMRELFPGEEEMGLHMNVPFGSSQSYRTPEGWTRVQTFLQYDEPTRRLWENLQKPYGNQSSFLRHLILLEKYFRKGDLVLSHKASENATVYSETIRNRLRSYDNVVVDDSNGSSNEDNDVVDITKSLLNKIPKHVSNLPITITTKPKQQSQNALNSSGGGSGSSANDGIGNSSSGKKSSGSGPSAGDSILKSNLLGKKSDSIEILPISNDNSGAGSSSSAMSKQQKLLAAASKLMSSGSGSGSSSGGVGERSSSLMSQQHQSSSQQQLQSEPKKSMINNGINLPPQLISINRGQNNVNTLNDSNSTSMSNRRRSASDHHSSTHRRNSKQIPPNVIILPDTLTATERLQSKNWRPTLMPVSQAAHLRQPGGPLYQTADGRRLPALVQVQSGGNPYLISIHDYNRMCILRREKIMREQLMKSRNLSQQIAQHNKSQFMGGRHSDPTTSSGMGGGSLSSRNSQHSLKSPPQQTSLLKNSLSTGLSPPRHNMPSMTSKLLGPPPSQLQILPQMPSTSHQHQHQLNSSSSSANSVSIIPSSLSGIIGGGGPLLPPSTIATNVSTSWLWNNINGGGPSNSALNKNILSFTANPSPSTSSASISPLKQHQQMQLQSMNNAPPLILDNNLLSKIPKSLTVIPQQKPQGRHSRGCSIDDLTSA